MPSPRGHFVQAALDFEAARSLVPQTWWLIQETWKEVLIVVFRGSQQRRSGHQERERFFRRIAVLSMAFSNPSHKKVS